MNKAHGKFNEVKTTGFSKDGFQIEYLIKQAHKWIDTQSGISLSVDKVLNIAKTITTIKVKVKLPISDITLTRTMLITAKHNSIAMLFDENFWKNF